MPKDDCVNVTATDSNSRLRLSPRCDSYGETPYKRRVLARYLQINSAHLSLFSLKQPCSLFGKLGVRDKCIIAQLRKLANLVGDTNPC